MKEEKDKVVAPKEKDKEKSKADEAKTSDKKSKKKVADKPESKATTVKEMATLVKLNAVDFLSTKKNRAIATAAAAAVVVIILLLILIPQLGKDRTVLVKIGSENIIESDFNKMVNAYAFNSGCRDQKSLKRGENTIKPAALSEYVKFVVVKGALEKENAMPVDYEKNANDLAQKRIDADKDRAKALNVEKKYLVMLVGLSDFLTPKYNDTHKKEVTPETIQNYFKSNPIYKGKKLTEKIRQEIIATMQTNMQNMAIPELIADTKVEYTKEGEKIQKLALEAGKNN